MLHASHDRLVGAALVAAMVLAGVNIVVGAPVAGLLVASRLTGEDTISMGAVLAFVVVAGAIGYCLVLLLARLGAAHDHLSHRDERIVRRHVPWMRPMAGERRQDLAEGRSLVGALDVVMITIVVVAVIAFEIWFAFYSGSPLDTRSGRG